MNVEEHVHLWEKKKHLELAEREKKSWGDKFYKEFPLK